MNDLSEKSLRDLLAAAKNAITVMRRNAELMESADLNSDAERAAVKELNITVSLVEYELFHPDERQELYFEDFPQ